MTRKAPEKKKSANDVSRSFGGNPAALVAYVSRGYDMDLGVLTDHINEFIVLCGVSKLTCDGGYIDRPLSRNKFIRPRRFKEMHTLIAVAVREYGSIIKQNRRYWLERS